MPYTTVSVIPDADELPVATMSGDIPVLEFRDTGGITIHIPHETPEQAIDWLRRLVEEIETLAGKIEAGRVVVA